MKVSYKVDLGGNVRPYPLLGDVRRKLSCGHHPS